MLYRNIPANEEGFEDALERIAKGKCVDHTPAAHAQAALDNRRSP